MPSTIINIDTANAIMRMMSSDRPAHTPVHLHLTFRYRCTSQHPGTHALSLFVFSLLLTYRSVGDLLAHHELTDQSQLYTTQ